MKTSKSMTECPIGRKCDYDPDGVCVWTHYCAGAVRPAFVTADEHRLIEIEEMRLACRFGDKRRYTAEQHAAIVQELVDAGLDEEARRDPDAIERVFRELNAIDEAERARRDIERGARA
jgi:hypothetical protein